MRLSACLVDEDVEVVSVDVPSATALRLREVGLTVGATVRVSHHAAFGGRVLALGTSRLALDATTAGLIGVRRGG